MAESLAAKGGGVGVDGWEGPVGVIGGEGRQGGQGLGFASCVEPVADAGAGPRLPAFECGQYVHIPEQDDGQGDVEEG